MNDTKQHMGHAVVAGYVRFFSVSSIKLFSREEPSGCPRRYYFRYVRGIKEPETGPIHIGKNVAKELETYLTSDPADPKDVLGSIARAGKPLLPLPGKDLEVEQPLGNVIEAIRLRDAGAPLAEIRKAAGLTAAGVPLTGAADLRHRRGFYVDEDGTLKKEDPGIIVTEIVDHKSTRRIVDHVTSGGKLVPGLAKTTAQILSDVQMLGYGVQEIERHPEVTHLRLGHIYYKTEGAAEALKRTGLIPAYEVLKRWNDRVEPIAREILDVAKEEDVSKIEPNLNACMAYHRPCFYTDICPKSTEQLMVSLFAKSKTKSAEIAPVSDRAQLEASVSRTDTQKESPSMSILSRIGKPGSEIVQAAIIANGANGATAPAAPVVAAPVTQAASPSASEIAEAEARRLTAIEAEKNRLRAEDAAAAQKAAVAATPAAPVAAAPAPAPAAPAAPVTSVVTEPAAARVNPNDCDIDEEYLVNGAKMKFAGTHKGTYLFMDAAGFRHKLDESAVVTRIPAAAHQQAAAAAAPPVVPPAPPSAPAVAQATIAASPVAALPRVSSTDTPSAPPEVVTSTVTSATIGAVNPPDAPPIDMRTAADPLPPEVSQSIVDPEIRAKVEAHAKAVAEMNAKDGDDDKPAMGGGRCPGGKIRIQLTMGQALKREVVCGTCGKTVGVKPVEAAPEVWEATLPGHNRPKVEVAAAANVASAVPGNPQVASAPTAVAVITTLAAPALVAAPVAAPVTSAVTQVGEPMKSSALPVIAPMISSGPVDLATTLPYATVYLDCAVIGQPQPKPLSEYYGPIVEMALKESGAIDLRCPPEGSSAGFGRWRGIVSALVKSRPIPSGEYLAYSYDEIGLVVVGALPVVTRIVRGVK